MSITSQVAHTMVIYMTDQEWAAVQQFIADRSRSPMIQEILPEHTPEEREFILSGITPQEWHRLFGEEE